MNQIYNLDRQELYQAYKYFSFFTWCAEEGWMPYVDEEMWINQSEGNKVRTVYELWDEYFKQLPSDIKDQL